ncbi:MAG: LemA family protein [Asticcacaulis sp.]|nr:LemA family protein [Asticcacaulis sp.]
MFKRVLGLIAVAGLALGLTGCGFNSIPTKEENAKTKWSQVQVEYKRRNDLIPQLVATVKGAAKQESSTLVAVTEARAKATQVSVDASTITDPDKFKQFQQAQDGLSSALGRLMVIQEQYPQLKTNENFLTLQSQIEGSQNRISVAQKDYNEAAQDYNTTLRTFPGIIWAKTAYGKNKPMEYFTAPESASEAPTIDFSDVGVSK